VKGVGAAAGCSALFKKAKIETPPNQSPFQLLNAANIPAITRLFTDEKPYRMKPIYPQLLLAFFRPAAPAQDSTYVPAEPPTGAFGFVGVGYWMGRDDFSKH